METTALHDKRVEYIDPNSYVNCLTLKIDFRVLALVLCKFIFKTLQTYKISSHNPQMLEVLKEANTPTALKRKRTPFLLYRKEEVLFSSSSFCQLYDAAKVAIIHRKI